MTTENHKAARPYFLSHGSSVLDALYNIWRKATGETPRTEKNDTVAAPYKVEAPFERHNR